MELKNCPFCGGQSEPLNFVGHGFVSYSARCKECHAMIPYFDSEEKAIKAWNTRLAFYPRDLYDRCFDLLECCDEPEWTFYNKIMGAVSEYERQKVLENVDISQYDTDIDF